MAEKRLFFCVREGVLRGVRVGFLVVERGGGLGWGKTLARP